MADEAVMWDDKMRFSVAWSWGGRRYTLSSDEAMKIRRSAHNRECLVVDAAGVYRPLTIERNGAPFANVPSFMEAEATVTAGDMHTVCYTEKGQTRRFAVGRTEFLLEWAWEGSEE